jgi:sugar (pentulose or hexulose) kinase
MRAMYFASLCSLRTGMNILTEQEGVVIEEIRGHGGFFKGGDTGQRMMAAALNVPVSIPATAGEGGAWGMAVLAAFMLRPDAGQALPDYLDERIAGSIGTPVMPDPRDVKGFEEFFARHARARHRARGGQGAELNVRGDGLEEIERRPHRHPDPADPAP